ncbi:LIC_13346 family putative lipoprotein [Leptospira interrogans]|uniref:LIC_13346 family putative lipoprotein n=1 Tax=Leptospira interrogans TaxID=173 RepID=UPI000AD1AF13
MKTIFKFLQPLSNSFKFLKIQVLIGYFSFIVLHCGSMQEILWTESISDRYTSRIFFTSSPFVSPYYKSSSFQARYIILKSESGSENEMIQGNLKYLEFSERNERENALLEVFEWKGPMIRNPKDHQRIRFSPKFVTKRLKTFSIKSETFQSKEEVFEDVKKEFVMDEKVGLRETEEVRAIPGIGTLQWKHSLRGILVKVMRTEFVSADGTVTSSGDYDYNSLEYSPGIGLNGAIPVLPIRKTEIYTEYYCLDFPSEIDLSVLTKDEIKKSVSFYDLITNKPFTITANFKNYPIIRISNEKNQFP